EDRLGFYLNDEWRVIPKLTLNAGARYDLDTYINPTISPRVALIYKPHENHSFRAALSVAYRPPTLFEESLRSRVTTTLPPPLPSPPPTLSSGSSNLNPEQIISYTVDYQGWFLNHRLRIRTDLFFNHLSDLIVVSSTGGATTPDVDIYGGE